MRMFAILAVLAIGVSGCSAVANTEAQPSVQENLQASEEATADSNKLDGNSADLDSVGEIEVEKNIFDVSITLPPDLASASSQDEVDANVSESGYSSGTLNADGSVTYQIPSNLHRELMDDVRVSVQETADQFVADEPLIYKSISFDKSVETFEVVVNRAEYENSYSFAAFGLTFAAGIYHVFSGEEDIQLKIEFIDEATGQVFDEYAPGDE